YGFLWPEKLYLGLVHQATEKQNSKVDEDHYRILGRAKVRPVYEFFPESRRTTRDFIINIIRYFSPLLMNECLFKLRNLETGCYLGREQNKVPALVPRNRNINHHLEDMFWKFRDDSLQNSLLFVFAHSQKFLLSERLSEEGLDQSIISKTKSDYSNLELIVPEEFGGQHSMDKKLRWTIHTLSNNDPNNTRAIPSLDEAIERSKVLKDGDIIGLYQDSFYLRGCYLKTSKSSTPPSIKSIKSTKSPSSMSSTDNKYNFSFIGESASNSTQPTTNSNATSLQKFKEIAIHSHPIVCIEKPFSMQEIQYSKEYQWEVELASRSEKDQSEANDKVIYSPSLKIKDSFKNIERNQISSMSSKASSHISESLQDKDNQEPQTSQWLDGNSKLYNQYHVSKKYQPKIDEFVQDDTSNQYNTPAESLQSIPSTDYAIMSSRKLEKQPLQNYLSQESKDNDDWTTSSASSHSSKSLEPFDKIQKTSLGSSSLLSEAETFKREIQQTYQEKENKIYDTIYRNIFSMSTPASNTSTSQIRYYDNEDDDSDFIFNRNPIHSKTSQQRSFNVTPRSKYSHHTTSSSTHLSPEEYLQRRKNREDSFMLLVRQETKQQIWLKAIKQSTLSHWLRSISTKKQKSTVQNDSMNEKIVRLQHHNSNNNTRTIHKKKGFYHGHSSNNRKSKDLIITL
ncbi:hypothetical protein CU098_001420, partial [Rhizopus stolonifer]